jgi:hypothetical protein
MLTAKDSHSKLEELVSSAEQQEISFDDIPRLHLKWISENYDKFDEDAQKQFGEMYDSLFDVAKQNIKQMPDSIVNRKLYRSARTGKGEHYAYENLFNVLATKPILDDIQSEGEVIAVSGIQSILDLLHDMNEREKADANRAVPISLIYGCIDEFSAALHLARHHFYLQANTHLRTVLETLDKVSLFIKFPENIDVFLSDDQEIARKELTPAKVREKLGVKQKHNLFYNFLSSHGPHPSLRTVQSRTTIQLNKNNPQNLVITIGGTNSPHLKTWFYLCCLMVVNFTLYSTIDLTINSINHQEATEMMERDGEKFIEYINNHLIPWAEGEGMDSTELKDFLERFPFGDNENR